MTADVLALEPWTAELLRLCKADVALNRDPDDAEAARLFRAGHTPSQAHEVLARRDADEGRGMFRERARTLPLALRSPRSRDG